MNDEGGPLLYGCDSEEQQNSFDSTCRMLHRFLSLSRLHRSSLICNLFEYFGHCRCLLASNPVCLLIELYYAGVSNCGLTASAKIYVLPDALKGWRQHWCNGLRQVGTVSWSFHRFLPTDTLRASKSCWMARASALQECICANRDSQNLQRGIMNALSISYATITPRTSESLYGLVPISLYFLH